MDTRFKVGQAPWNKGLGKQNTCKKCGINYPARKRGKYYCSRACGLSDGVTKATQFKKGLITWNAGTRRTIICKSCGNEFKLFNKSGIYCSRKCWQKDDAWKQKTREKHLASGHKPIQPYAGRGPASHSWRGGKSSERHTAMGRTEYKQWRDSVFKRDNYTCQICNSVSIRLHADHIKGWSKYPKLRYETSNGRTLCVPCHYYVTFNRKMIPGMNWGGLTL